MKKVKSTVASLKDHSRKIHNTLSYRNKLPFFTLAFIISAMIITVLAVQQQQTLVQEAATLEDCPTTTETDNGSTRTPEERAARQATRAARQGTDGRTVTSVITNEPKITKIVIHETVAPTIIVNGKPWPFTESATDGGLGAVEKDQVKNGIKGQLLVKYKKGASRKTAKEKVKKRKGKLKKRIDQIDTEAIVVPVNEEAATLQELRSDPDVAHVERDTVHYPVYVPNDTFFTKQFGLNNTGQTINELHITTTADIDINAPEAWDKSQGEGIVVAVLDTGIDESHPDLKGKIVGSKDFAGSGSVEDKYGHGTAVAGVVAANTNNNEGIAGVCPKCKLLIGKITSEESRLSTGSSMSEGIIWATDQGAKVINISFAGTGDSQTREDAINYATDHGVVVVAAAGNSGNCINASTPCPENNPVMYPAAYPKVISVGAIDQNGQKTDFSEYGTWVDVSAPGEHLIITAPTKPYTLSSTLKYRYGKGTSYASPTVAGVAALVIASGTTSVSDVTDKIQNTARKINGTGTYFKYGLVDAAAAVESSGNGAPNPSTVSGTAEPTRSGTKNPCRPSRSGTKTPNGPTKTPDSGNEPRIDPRRLGCSIYPKLSFCKDLQNGNTGGRPCNTNPGTNTPGSGRNGQENTSNKTGNVNIGKINNDGTSNTKITINGKEVTAEGSTFQNGEDINTGGQQGGSHRTEINIDRSGQNQTIDRSGTDGNTRTNTRSGTNTGGCDNGTNIRTSTNRSNTGSNTIRSNTRDKSGNGGGLLCRFAPWLRMCNRSTQTTRSSTMNRNGVRGAATINSFLLEENVIYACMAREKSCTPEQKAAADRNKDGKVNRTDYNILMNELQQISP